MVGSGPDEGDTTREDRAADALERHRLVTRWSRSKGAVPHSTTQVQGWSEDVPDNPYL